MSRRPLRWRALSCAAAAFAACSAPAAAPDLTAALARWRAGDAPGAAAAYQQAQARCARAPIAHRAQTCAAAQLGEGELWEAFGEPDKARAAYSRALEAPATDAVGATACVRLGRLELAREQPQAAWRALWRAVTDWPDEPSAGDALRLLVEDGRRRDARALVHAMGEALSALAQTNVADNLLWSMADLTERELADGRAARAIYDRIPRDTPKSGLADDARWHAARLSRALGDAAGAATRLRELLATREVALGAGSYFSIWLDDAQLELGRVLRDELGQPRAAVAELRRLERDYPASILIDDATWERALALVACGDVSSACDAIAELLRRFPDSKHATKATAHAQELRCPPRDGADAR